MSRSTDKVRFGSDEWIAGIRHCLSDLVSDQQEAANGVPFQIVETAMNVPPDLAPAIQMNGSLSWHIVIDGPRSRAGRGRVEAPDVDLSYDYHAILPLARWIYTEADEPQVARFRAGLARAGTLSAAGDSRALPTVLTTLLRDLHNRIALITA